MLLIERGPVGGDTRLSDATARAIGTPSATSERGGSEAELPVEVAAPPNDVLATGAAAGVGATMGGTTSCPLTAAAALLGLRAASVTSHLLDFAVTLAGDVWFNKFVAPRNFSN